MFTARHPSIDQDRSAGLLYRQVAVESQIGGDADPHRLVEMLFDGVKDAIVQARGAIHAGDPVAKGRAISRAVRIVDEGLRSTLDLQQGGALAQDLHNLYGYVTTRLTQANLKSDEGALDECASLIAPLREAWAQIRPAIAVGRGA
jgi:flagellar protein FliS